MIENEEKIIPETPVVQEERKSTNKKFVFGYVTGGSLNLRAEPDPDADVLVVLSDGEPVVLDSTTPINGYYKVTAHNTIGYCMKEFITVK